MTDWTARVECAFTTAPSDPAPDWEDITDYVESPDGVPVGIERGRPDEFSEVAPGTCSVQLVNADGRFTPGNASSPYYPNVKKGRRLRVLIDYAGVTYTRFDGYVDQWPQTWPGGDEGYAVASVTCSDRLKRLGRIGNLRSLLEQEILLDEPTAYYTLGEAEGAVAAGNSSDITQPSLDVAQVGTGGTIEFGAGTGPGTDGMSAPVFTRADATNGKHLLAFLSQDVAVGRFSDATLRASFLTSLAADQVIASIEDVYGRRLEIGVTATGELRANLHADLDPTASATITSVATVSDGATHDVAVTTTTAAIFGDIELFLDGVSVGTAATTLRGPYPLRHLRVGGRTDGRPLTGTISHVAVYTTALTAARIAGHAEAASDGFEGDSTDERIERLATYAGIAAADLVLDAGDSTSLVAQATDGQSPLSLMQAVANTESGLLFVDTQGRLTFHNRSRRFNAAPEMTLSAEDGDISPDLTFVLDDQFKVNDLTVSRPGGATQRIVNQDSIDDDDRYVETLEVLTTSDLEAADIGNWRVYQYGDAAPRCPQVGLMLHAQSSASGFADIFVDEFVGDAVPYTVLNTDLGVKIRLDDLPANAPDTTLDLFVEGYAEAIGTHTWTIDYNTSPADGAGSIFRFDDPVYGRFDAGNKLAY